MALIDCRECGEKVSTKAKACPKCGAKPKKKFSILKWFVAIPAAVFALAIVVGMFEVANMTPEEKLAYEEKQAAQKVIDDEAKAIRDEERAAQKVIDDEAKAIRDEERAAQKVIDDEAKAIRDKERAAQKVIDDEAKAKAAVIEAEKRQSEKAAEQAAKVAEEREYRLSGFHCLSSWNGTHTGVVSIVKDLLNDPDSFEHDETLVAPVLDGRHRFTMKYRAKNAFGGIVRGNATGTYSNIDCADIELSQAQ